MKNILARGGVEFLAVLLGITLSLYIDQQIEESATVKTEKSLLSDLQVSLNQDIDYAQEVLEDMRGSINAQEILINFECSCQKITFCIINNIIHSIYFLNHAKS